MVAVERAACLVGGRFDRRNAFGDVPRRGEAGEPAVGKAAGAAKLGRCPPTEPDLERLLDRLGSTRAPTTEKRSPSWSTTASSQSRCMRGKAHSATGPGPCGRLESLVLGGVGDAEPERREVRPPLTTSRLASILAIRIGLRPGTTETAGPNFRCSLRPAT